jgi:type II secretory pathway pseudopilin PulG
MKKHGFTLLEYLIYIGIVAMVLVAMLDFAWVLMNDQAKQEITADLNDLGVHSLDQMTYYGHRASSISPTTVYNTNPGTLIFSFSSGPDVIFDTYQDNIMVGDIPVTITKLRMEEAGGSQVDLTSDRVDVTDFVITDLSGVNSTTINIDLTFESVNPEESKVYESENSWSTTITRRAH